MFARFPCHFHLFFWSDPPLAENIVSEPASPLSTAGAQAPTPSLQPSVFKKTEVSGPVEDDVVQQLDANDCARSLELGGDVDVAR